MKITQVYPFINDVFKMTVGQTAVAQADVSWVDMGNAVFAGDFVSTFNKNLVDMVTRQEVVFNNYSGFAPSLMMEEGEYGSVIQKIRFEIADEAEAAHYLDLQDGTSYDQDVYKGTQAKVKYFNNKAIFRVHYSLTEEMLKSAFASETAMLSYINGIVDKAQTEMTMYFDELIQGTISSFVSGVNAAAKPTQVKHIITDFNNEHGTQLTIDTCYKNPEFLKDFAFLLKEDSREIQYPSTLFSATNVKTLTPADKKKILMLSKIKNAVGIYLQADTFHNELVALPEVDDVPYWQGTGTDNSISSRATINVVDAAGNNTNVKLAAILYDKRGMAVSAFNKRVSSHRNDMEDFTNFWLKEDGHWMNDLDENAIIYLLD